MIGGYVCSRRALLHQVCGETLCLQHECNDTQRTRDIWAAFWTHQHHISIIVLFFLFYLADNAVCTKPSSLSQ